MKRWIGRIGLLTIALAIIAPSEADDEKTALQKLMKQKLTNAQKVLEGVALEDFDTISKHAGELTAVSKAAEFSVMKTAKYEMYSNDFRRITESLAEHAKDKNLDGAALAYVDLTLNCVKCHKYVREVRMTRNEPQTRSDVTVASVKLTGIPDVAVDESPQEPKKERSAFMDLKLNSAQSALNGIAVANLPLIETSATELVMLSRKAEFQLMKTEAYGKQSEAFRRSAEELLKSAKAKNLDGAALAYVQLTLNCVSCHKHVRDAR